ncbi:MAG: ParA family protein [Chloroflexi bacterium]|nr:ParA family protein [Chloroflexota bacterium]
MPRVIAIVNRKGGSGKTVTAFNMAGAFAEADYRVLTIDLDPQGSLSKGLAISPGSPAFSEVLIRGGEGFTDLVQLTHIPNLYIVPSDPDLNGIETGLREVPGRELRLRRCLAKFMTEHFEYILLDCPPSLGALTVNALVAAGDVVIPVDCGSYGRDALGSTIATIEFTKEEINYNLRVLGVLVCNVNSRTTYDQLAESSIRQQFGQLVFSTSIPTSIKIDEAAEAKKPLVFYDPRSSLAQRYRDLVAEIVDRFKGGP